MKIYLKHISVCLLFVFSFPIVYQAIHIHSTHAIEHSCCHCPESKTDDLICVSTEESLDNCAVCDYEIASFNLSRTEPLLSENLTFKEVNYADIQKVYIAFSHTSSSPRAPPAR